MKLTCITESERKWAKVDWHFLRQGNLHTSTPACSSRAGRETKKKAAKTT